MKPTNIYYVVCIATLITCGSCTTSVSKKINSYINNNAIFPKLPIPEATKDTAYDPESGNILCIFDTTGNETIEGYQLPEVQYHCPINLLRYLNLKIPSNIMLQTMIDYMYTNPHADDHTYYTHNDHLGSASWITYNGTKPVQYLHYLPYGQLLTNQQLYTYDERFKFIGKERDQESGYDFFGARSYCSPFKHWLSPDPLSDKDPGVSSYAYCRWNPIRLVDYKGASVNVIDNLDGTYSVKSGVLDNDLNIYLVDQTGERTGDILGQTFSKYSFFDTSGNIVKSNINVNDQSGNAFISDLKTNSPTLIEYIGPKENGKSGRNFGRYDFKSQGKSELELKNMKIDEQTKYYYRGMPITLNGKITYGTARDVGNFGAGYIAGLKGIGIIPTLLGFDIYQSIQMGHPSIEPPVSRIPQLKGYVYGLFNILR